MMKVSDDLHNRCHEANQIYALVEADAERQVIDKIEWLWEKARVVKIDDDTLIFAKTISILLSLDKAAVVNGVRWTAYTTNNTQRQPRLVEK